MRTSPPTPRRFVEIADRTERSLFFAATELIHAIEILSWAVGPSEEQHALPRAFSDAEHIQKPARSSFFRLYSRIYG